MNVVAGGSLSALRAHGVPVLPAYARALTEACRACPPLFGKRAYGDLYRRSARDPDWVALSLATAAQSEGEGARHLWDMAASTADGYVADQLQQHAIDEARHSRGYVTLLGIIYPQAFDCRTRDAMQALSPGYTRKSPLVAPENSPYAAPATVDELIQMNIAEIRTRFYHLLQRPVLLAACEGDALARVRRILDSLLIDETRHIAYTACLIERAAAAGTEVIMDLMRRRMREFNDITEDEFERRALSAA